MATHEIVVSEENTYTPGGNQYCTCGEMIGPGQFVAHLQWVIEDLEDDIEVLKSKPIFAAMDVEIGMRSITENCYRCARCLDAIATPTGMPFSSMQMIVCTDCGNKRCPKAADHKNECTRSNEPGQEGSRYP